jgi:hypothetical protein
MDTVQWIKTLESRVLGNGQARFGGGPGEKDWKQHLACGLSYFVVLHPTEDGVIKARAILEAWLQDMGLELKPSKTRITYPMSTGARKNPPGVLVKSH